MFIKRSAQKIAVILNACANDRGPAQIRCGSVPRGWNAFREAEICTIIRNPEAIVKIKLGREDDKKQK
jgi:hypothetical protein